MYALLSTTSSKFSPFGSPFGKINLGIRLSTYVGRGYPPVDPQHAAHPRRLYFPRPHDDVHRGYITCYILWKGSHPSELSCVMRKCVTAWRAAGLSAPCGAAGLASSVGWRTLHTAFPPCGALQAVCTGLELGLEG